MKRKIWCLLIVLTLLIPLSPATAAPDPAEPPPLAQEQAAQSYLLQLAMPEVELLASVQPADVPGYYQAALYRQWTEVEGVLRALQEIGLVEEYTLLPEANAFRLTARPKAAEQLEQLGALSEPRLMATAAQAGASSFQRRLDAAVQDTQRQTAPPEAQPISSEQPTEPLAEPTPPAPESLVEPTPPAPKSYLVRLVPSNDPVTAGEQQHQMDAYLDWLVREGEGTEYEWLPQAYAFRVVAEGELERLSSRPEVEGITPYSDEAVQEARAAFDDAQEKVRHAAPLASVGIMAYTPTTPTVEVRLYDNEVDPRSYTNTTTVFTLTTSSGIVKDVETLCPTWGTGCDDDWNGSPGNYYEQIYFDWPAVIESGDILYVAQEGEAPYYITLPTLTANANPDADTVTGQAPPNITSTDPITPPVLYVGVTGSQYVTTTATGDYLADNVGDFDPGDQGQIRYYDANGNQVYRYFSVPVVYVRGYSDEYNQDNFVSGYVADPNVPVTVTLKRMSSTVDTYYATSGSSGDFYAYLSQNIQGGDTVEVECGGTTTVVNVPTFSSVASDPDADTVTGNTDATVVTNTYGLTQTLAVWPESTYDWDYGKYVLPDGSGDFTAANPFYYSANPANGDSTRDWGLGATGHLRYVNADGNRVYERFNAPYPAPVLYVRGYRNYDRYQDENTIGGYITGCYYEYLDLLVKDSTGVVKDQESRQCDNSGRFYWYLSSNIEPGDVVSATFAGKTTTVTVPDFNADVDVDTDTVTGVITDATVLTDTYGLTQTLTLWPQTTSDDQWSAYRSVIPTSGAFTAANPFNYGTGVQTTTVDINFGDVGHARYTDGDKNRVYFRFQPPPGAPVLYVRGWDDYNQYYAMDRVGGYVPGYCHTIHGYGTVTLLDSSGAVKAQDTQVEACDEIRADLNVNIEPGDVVSATFGGKTTTVTVPYFKAASDPDADTVTGNTDATIVTTTYGLTQTLTVWPNTTYDYNNQSDRPFRSVIPVTGDFTAANPFYYWDWGSSTYTETTLDIRPGNLGHLRYILADGNRVYDAFRAPIVYVRGDSGNYQADNYVRAGIDPNTEITVTLKRSGSVLATASGTSDNNGNYSVYLTDVYNNPAYIQEGDTVEAAFSGRTITVDVPTLTADADSNTDVVSGVGPFDVVTTTWGLTHTLQVYVDWPSWTTLNVTTTHGGGYSADFTPYGGINPGSDGWLRYVNTDGNYIYDDFVAPIVYVRGSSGNYQADNYVGGYAPAGNALVTLELKRGGATIATAYDMSSSSSYYSVYFYDAYGNPVDIESGDTVEVECGGATTTVGVPEFDVTSDADKDRVTGTTDATVVTSTYGLTQTLAVWPTSYYDWDYGKYVTITTSVFTATNPFYYNANPANGDQTLNWYPGQQGHLRYVDAGGNYVYDDFQASYEYPKPIVYARGDYNRYQAENYVSGYAPNFCGYGTVTLKDSGGAVKSQATNVYACNNFGVYLNDIYGNPVDIEPGDTVEATFQGQTTVVEVPEFDVTSDADTDTVSGSTDATVVTSTYGLTQTLAVWPTSYYDSNYGKYVTTTASVFTATNPFYWEANPASGSTNLDWGPGTSGHLRYVDADNNHVYARFQAEAEYTKPVVYLRGRWRRLGCSTNYEADNYVSGRALGCYSEPATVVLKDAFGNIKDQRQAFCCADERFYTWLAEDIEAGDTVEVTQGDQTTVVDVPSFDVTSDADKDRVTGTTGATVVTSTYGLTQTLAVWPTSYYDSDYGKHVLPASGTFTATNPFYYYADPSSWSTNLDWGEGATGHLRYVDANSNRVYASFVAPRKQAEIHVHKDSNYVWGYVVTDQETPVTVTLRSGVTTKSTAFDVSSVSGYFDVNFYDTSADFRGVDDITPGEQVQVQHLNSDGHYVYIQFYAGPKLYAQLNSYYAWGYSVAANAPVTLTLKEGSGTVKGTGSATSNNSNYFSAYLYDATGQRAIIAAGDTLEADFGGGNVVTMTVTGMTANVDADADAITGTGPSDTPLGVEVGNFDQTVTTGGSGAWSADASGIEDITPGEQVLVKHINENYHETWLYAVAPVVYVRASGSGQTSYQADSYVSGYATRRAVVDVTLQRGGATVATRRLTTWWDGMGYYYSTYLYDALGLDADIQGNDEIVIAASTPFTITVPGIQATVDAETDTVAGSGPANADLGIYVNSGYNQTAHTDASGVFTATFTSINPGNYAYIRYQNVDGHWIHARFQAENNGDTVIYARWNVKRGGSTLATATDLTDSNRWFNVAFTDAAGEDVPLENGDVIEAAASDPVSMTVAALTAQANRESGVLYGAGPANANLYYWYRDSWGSSYSDTRTIGPDGHYNFDLGFGNQASGYVRYTSTDGHRTYLGWAVPYVGVRENSNYVYGYVERGVPVTVRLLSSGGAERGTATTTSDSYNGYFWVNFLDAAGNPLIINPNDTVVVQASPAINVPVTPLSADVDLSNDQVTGSGPANEELEVRAGGCWRNVTAATDGSYTADFSDECDLKAGDFVGVYYWNDEGNQVYIEFHAPLVRVNAVNDIVDGYAMPNASVSLTLKRGSSDIATATASTDVNGFFSAFFTDASGNLVDIQAGDVVEVTASPTVSVPVVDLSATVNTSTDVVSGSGPANSTLLVKAFAWTGWGWDSVTKAAYTDGYGNFSVDFSGELDLTDVSYAYVRYSDADSNQTGYTTTPSRSPLVDQVEQDVQGQGATVETSTFGAANGGDLTPPVLYNGGGGGRLVFASRRGSLVLTRPDGSVDDNGDTLIIVDSAPNGEWKVQVRVWGGEGEQYAIAIGKAAHIIYLPLVVCNFSP